MAAVGPLPSLASSDSPISYKNGGEAGEYNTYQASSHSGPSEQEEVSTPHKRKDFSLGGRRNAKQKSKLGNESALAVMCQWIVDHQIGIQGPPDLS